MKAAHSIHKQELYAWQKECLDAWEENDRRGIVHVVTGAGKTFFALAAIEQARGLFPDLMVRIVVPTIPLAHQWEKSLLHHIGPEAWRPGFFGGGERDDPDRHVMIYIVNSARDSLAGHIRRDLALGKHVFLICDECHHYQSRENRKIFGFLNESLRSGRDRELYLSLGLSATPFGTADDSVLKKALGPEIYRYGFDSAVREGVISPFTVCEVSASFFPEEREAYAELTDKVRTLLARLYAAYPKLKGMADREFMRTISAIAKEADMDPEEPACAFLLLTYRRKEISTLARARDACCLSILERLSREDRILIFCERISQTETVAARIRRRFGRTCGIYHSEMDRDARTRVLNEFRENRIRILVSCRCLDEGIDVPDANIGIVLSSTAVERQRIQRLGRVIRRAPGKAAACLYYIYIRESTDDAAFLTGLEECETFNLRYYPAEGVFSNELYEYVGAGLVRRAREKGYTQRQQEELRSCLTEGLIRPDYLLPEPDQAARSRKAQTIHLRNYWKLMRRVGDEFRGRDEHARD